MNSKNVRELLRKQFHTPPYAYAEATLDDTLFYSVLFDVENRCPKMVSYDLDENGMMADTRGGKVVLRLFNASRWSTLSTYTVHGEPTCAILIYFEDGVNGQQATVVYRDGAF